MAPRHTDVVAVREGPVNCQPLDLLGTAVIVPNLPDGAKRLPEGSPPPPFVRVATLLHWRIGPPSRPLLPRPRRRRQRRLPQAFLVRPRRGFHRTSARRSHRCGREGKAMQERDSDSDLTEGASCTSRKSLLIRLT
jgi:hypothetical protein